MRCPPCHERKSTENEQHNYVLSTSMAELLILRHLQYALLSHFSLCPQEAEQDTALRVCSTLQAYHCSVSLRLRSISVSYWHLRSSRIFLRSGPGQALTSTLTSPVACFLRQFISCREYGTGSVIFTLGGDFPSFFLILQE